MLNRWDILAPDPRAVLADEFPDFAVLFHCLTGEAVPLSPVATAIWRAVDGRCTVADLTAAVTAEFGEAPGTVLDDTVRFLEALHERLFIAQAAGNPAD